MRSLRGIENDLRKDSSAPETQYFLLSRHLHHPSWVTLCREAAGQSGGPLQGQGVFWRTLAEFPFSVISSEGQWSHPLCHLSYFLRTVMENTKKSATNCLFWLSGKKKKMSRVVRKLPPEFLSQKPLEASKVPSIARMFLPVMNTEMVECSEGK